MLDESQREPGTKADLVMSGSARVAIMARELEKTQEESLCFVK